MKKLYSGILAMLLFAGLHAQTGTASTSSASSTTATTTPENCYTKWEAKFQERGADDVKDSTYNDVIITVRTGADAHCYNGKVVVKGGCVVTMYRQLQDGSFEEYKPKAKFDVPITITNGISKTLLTKDDDLVNVIFPKTLKPKKVGYSSAPEPPED
ncbi:MAG TPA: hypothetical protein VL651_08315 [Bacteroidia bacterium]|jgi:hypothetical protein|nr:hypothetical protein [Bacteroidia bacterium]